MSQITISTAQFKQLLSKYAKVEEAEASAFVDAVINTVTDRLENGESVEIAGFGVFQIVEAQQGQIRRVAFVADDKIKEAVNAPFACFEPFVVSEGKKSTELAEVAELPEIADVSEVAELPEVAEPEIPEEAEIMTIEEHTTEIPEEHTTELPGDHATEIPEEIANDPEVVEEEPATVETPKVVIEETPADLPTKRSMLKPVLWIAVIALCLLGLWWFLSSKQPKQTAVQPALPVAEVTTDTMTAVAEPIEPEPQAAEPVVQENPVAEEPAPQKPTKQQLLLNEDGSPRMFALEPGERLTLIALNVYGDKAFWCYIFDVNAFMLTNPDNVPVGVQLYLPDPTYYNIEADDQLSLRRARNRGAKILNSKK